MKELDVGQLGIPDGIEPLVGWRYWRADEGWLCSLNKFKTWPAGRPLRAQCTLAMDHGPLPGLAAALAQGDEMFRAELARLRGTQPTEAIARSAFEASFGHNEGKSYPAP